MSAIFNRIFQTFLTKLLLIFFLFSAGLNSRPLDTHNAVIASVGNYNIYEDQFTDRYTNYLVATGIKDNITVREAILNNMINEILLYYYDKNDVVFSDTEYQNEIAWSEKQSVLGYLKDRDVYAKINVTEDEIRQAFLRVNEQIAVSHLFAPTLEEAEKLYKLLEIGVDWDNLAAQVFTDSTLKSNGGYLGYFTWGDLDPAFEDAAYSMQVGEISKPIKTDYGYSIIRLDDKISNPLLTESDFQTKKAKLERVLRIKKKPEYEKKYLASIFDESKYSLIPESLDDVINYFKLSDIQENENSIQYNPKAVCVIYDTKKYSEQFIIDRIKQIPNYHRNKISSQASLKLAVKGVILQSLLYSDAVNKGYDKNPFVIAASDKLKKQIFLKYKMKQILAGMDVSDSVLYHYFNDNRESFKSSDEISIQEIILKDKSLADSLASLLNDGKDFGELARNFSLREFSQKNNGIIDYSPISKFGFLKSEFWQAKIGEIIGPKELHGAYGIFKVLGKKNGVPKEFDEIAKSDLELAYKNEFEKDIINNYLNNIRKNVPININLMVLNSPNILNQTAN